MNKLNLDEMQAYEGSGDAQTVTCWVGVALLFTPYFLAGAIVVGAACLSGDSRN